MNQVVPILALLLVATSAFADNDLVLTDFQLIDGTGAPVKSVDSMWIEDGVIVAIGQQGRQPTNPGSTISLSGAFVMPGLIDTHVHIARFPDTRNHAVGILDSALQGGITSVRDLGGEARALNEITRANLSGESVGPTLIFSALFGGQAVFEAPQIQALAAGHEPGTAAWMLAVSADTSLPLAVAAARGAGVHGIKLYGNLDRQLASEIIAAAKVQKLLTWAHGTVFPAGPQDLVDAGIHSLSHAPYLVWAAAPSIPDDYGERTRAPWGETAADDPKIVHLLKSMAEKGVLLDATLYVFNEMQNFSPEVKAGWAGEAALWGAEITALAHELGVRVTTGTDWFEPREKNELPHTHDELALLVEKAGFSPMDAIVAGTRNGAEALGVLNQRGTIEIGKAADLLILNRDPSQHIRHTRSIRNVIKDGALVHRP